ncbi:cadherin-related family member 5 [Mastacembelus armatus]|uniref:cadherin-related family member 5 n=1 Tax=Mastacembelus armatus TaxID=205130 RepID=UPI000E4589AB|nr:cadherin-related family member 5 [Mastacembelus armatus]
MDTIHLHFTVRTSFTFLLLILLQTSTEAADICSAPTSVQIPENNKVGEAVVTITVQTGVTLEFSPPPANLDNPFRLEGNQLIAATVLDYETARNHIVRITCSDTATSLTFNLVIVVVVLNENDNPPVFDQNPYRVSVNEMSPVGTTVGHFAATDLDQHNELYYTLTSEANDFELKSPTVPDLIVAKLLDYDKVKNVQLVLNVQDTPLTAVDNRTSFTATTTILVTIIDVDNRPPWFQPCTKHEVGGAVVCQSAGYTGRVVLNEQETGILPLKPGPLYAIDGDSGINEELIYSFLSGNDARLFEINPSTGNISMLKAADVLETMSLTVLASQKTNSYQFATTTVTISVQVKSLHRPKFQRPQYEGILTAVGVMAMDLKNKDEPLRILATDDDYTATGGLNPHITYSINGSSDISIVDGYIFMTKALPEATLSLQVVATDTSNDESATAQLSVEVTSGLTSTTLIPSTIDIMTTMSVSTSNTKTSTNIKSTTSAFATSPSVTTTSAFATSPSVTPSSAFPTSPSVTPSMIIPSGGYGPADMAALGATLGVLLFICLVVIGLLVYRMRKGKADWRKIKEVSVFRGSLGQALAGHKGGIQYTNEAFQNDEDGSSMGSSGPEGGMVAGELRKVEENVVLKDAIARSSASLTTLLPDDSSQAGSDRLDNEKEVKPILTKERRVEEGYKAVWFKEDIDPDAKEEVVIIPESREDNSEEENEERSGRRYEQENPMIKTPKVVFGDADLDSGLGVKMEDLAEDSDGDEVLTVDL